MTNTQSPSLRSGSAVGKLNPQADYSLFKNHQKRNGRNPRLSLHFTGLEEINAFCIFGFRPPVMHYYRCFIDQNETRDLCKALIYLIDTHLHQSRGGRSFDITISIEERGMKP